MADKKVTQLTDLGNGLAAVDLFHVVDDPSGTPINKKITAEDVVNNIPSWLGLNSTRFTLSKGYFLRSSKAGPSLCPFT